MLKWLRSIDWLPLTITALIIVLSFNFLSWLGFPASNQQALGGQPLKIPWPHPDAWVAIFTLTLTLSTIFLWWETRGLAREARDSAKTLIDMERPYLTGGGDFENKTGMELFRLDAENHGKTPAFLIAYDIQFAKLEELRKEPTARPFREKHFRHIDGFSPAGARKKIYTQIPMCPDADAVYGTVWYEDPILGIEHFSRFILRINATRDIPKEGLTRLDVEGVSREYPSQQGCDGRSPKIRGRRLWLGFRRWSARTIAHQGGFPCLAAAD
jgi:hypothetical protein